MKIHQSQDAPVDTASLREAARSDRANLEAEAFPESATNLPAATGRAASGPKDVVATEEGETDPETDEQRHVRITEERQREFERLKVQQKQRKKALNLCEPLITANHASLSLRDYPDHQTVEAARRRRDLWVLSCCLFFAIFLLGVVDLINPLIAGISFGAFAAAMALAIPPLRQLFFQTRSYRELITQRREQEYKAISHIRMLEGRTGLARHFYYLVDYNHALKHRAYQKIMQISARGHLLRVLNTPGRIRLYENLLVEAEQAYDRLKNVYFETDHRLGEEFRDLQNAKPTEAAAVSATPSNSQSITVTPNPPQGNAPVETATPTTPAAQALTNPNAQPAAETPAATDSPRKDA